MNIVLIEDDLQKAERVVNALKSIFADCCIFTYRSYQSGLRGVLAADKIDLVILDMSLPTYDPLPNARHGRPRSLGGYDIMRKLKRLDRKPAVVVLTALENFGSAAKPFTFSELERKCTAEFPDQFRGAIYYSQSKIGWKSELESALRGIDEKTHTC